MRKRVRGEWLEKGRFPNVAFSTQNFSEVARQHGIQKEASHRLSRCRSWQSYKSALQRLALSMRQGRSSLIKKDEGNRLNTPWLFRTFDDSGRCPASELFTRRAGAPASVRCG